MENRKSKGSDQEGRTADLPGDYLKMVTDIFTTHFDAELKALSNITSLPYFVAHGRIYLEEVVLCVSLHRRKELAATTAYASSDFDPKASSPKAEDLLSACVDALAGLYTRLLDLNDPTRLEAMAHASSLSAFEEVPFEWSPVEIGNRKIYLKVDKANPVLEKLADDWLIQHAPEVQEELKREEAKTEKLFFTGPKAPGTLDEDEDPDPTRH